MRPNIEVCQNSSLIVITYGFEMSKDQIIEFLSELESIVIKLNSRGAVFSVLNNASEKTFVDLAAVRELSVGLRRVLSLGKLDRIGVYRPQGDYLVEETGSDESKIKVFSDVNEAENWLKH